MDQEEYFEQAEHLGRVSERIGGAVQEFIKLHLDSSKTFYASELQTFVAARCGKVAPSSPTRILQNLRASGILNYCILNRRKSLYQALPNEERA